MKHPTPLALVLALAAFCGCVSPSTSLRGLAQDQHDDVVQRPRSTEDVAATGKRVQERADKVRKLLAGKDADGAADHYHAALVLVQCTREADLELAHSEALRAAELGEVRGLRLAAEALDKLLFRRGMMQRYGTQFVWEPVLREWHVYPIDPRTTDEERVAMGVPTRAEIQKQEDELNKQAKAKSGAKTP